MADIVNERDRTLQTAATRTIELEPPPAVIIPGYTGMVLTPDYHMFVSTFGRGPYAVSGVVEFKAQRRGIPPDIPVLWDTGGVYTYPTGAPESVGLEVIDTNAPGIRFKPPAGYTQYWKSVPNGVRLTDTTDPLVKLLRDADYPIVAGQSFSGPSGFIRVRANYGGQLFAAFAQVSTFYG